MKITEKQLHTLVLVLKDSVAINIQGMFSMSHGDRLKLLSDILNQQSDEIINIGDLYKT